ncbi:hypothetical protein IFM89_014470 [Coptis chinensis]|uniref:DUF295 domain-containing protein n=1 Tax=Coptis chinensis TaxID=261450 RepID=A0A835I2G1_9MAGN|nr:hypothetical protein IFM89_014470 [Coptis chinensis]
MRRLIIADDDDDDWDYGCVGTGFKPKVGNFRVQLNHRDCSVAVESIPRWKEVKHDNTVTWLAFWNDPINPKEFKDCFTKTSSLWRRFAYRIQRIRQSMTPAKMSPGQRTAIRRVLLVVAPRIDAWENVARAVSRLRIINPFFHGHTSVRDCTGKQQHQQKSSESLKAEKHDIVQLTISNCQYKCVILHEWKDHLIWKEPEEENALDTLGEKGKKIDWTLYFITLFWNLNFWDNASILAGEVDKPQSTFPKALFLARIITCPVFSRSSKVPARRAKKMQHIKVARAYGLAMNSPPPEAHTPSPSLFCRSLNPTAFVDLKAIVYLPRYLVSRAPERSEPRAVAVESIMEVVRAMELEDQIGFVELAFCKPGDKEWTVLDQTHTLMSSVIYFQNQLFVLNIDGTVFNCDLNHPHPKLSVVVVAPYSYGVGDTLDERYLVELSGDLLLIRDFVVESVYHDRFLVFKLDQLEVKWIKVKSLGGHSLFLGANSPLSLPAVEFPGCKPDCIYFTDDYYLNCMTSHGVGPRDMGVFSLEDGTLEHFQMDGDMIFPPAIWLSQLCRSADSVFPLFFLSICVMGIVACVY